MEIKLEVNDEQFKNLLQEGIDALTPEEKKQIILNGFQQYMTSQEGVDIIKNIVFEKPSGYWDRNYKLSATGTKILASCINDSDFFELRELVLDIIKEHGKEVIIKALGEALLTGLFNDSAFSSELHRQIQASATMCIDDHINNMHSNQT